MKKRNWFITGISSGLGKSLAQATIESGDFVIGTVRKKSDADDLNEMYEGKGLVIQMDLTDSESIERAKDQAISTMGHIDVLVNNAGMGFVGAIEETSMDEARKVFETNFFGALKVTQCFLPHMRETKSGHIMQISSHGGIKAFAGFGMYNASKFALEGFSEALAQEVEPMGIKISIVEPGPFRTKFAGTSLAEAKEIIEDYHNTAGAFRSKLKSVDGLQEGDPAKAAKAIIAHISSEKPTLRLPLGKTSLVTIGMKLESVRSDLEVNREIANQVVFE